MRRLLRHSRLRIRRGITWLWTQEGTPGQRARGLAAGVFCGCYPFFGLQIFLSVGVATLVRGNHLLAAAGTLVSNPLTYLPLYWFNYVVGCRLLGMSGLESDLTGIDRTNLWNQGWSFSHRILLGSSVVAAVMSLVVGTFAFFVFQRRLHQASRRHRMTSRALNSEL